MRVLVFSLVLGAFVFAAAFQGAKAPTYKYVAPILKAHCEGCHSGPKAAHGLNLTSYANIIKGDKEGKVVVPRSMQTSRMAKVLHGKPMQMPPGAKLPAANIKMIENWIKGGAKK